MSVLYRRSNGCLDRAQTVHTYSLSLCELHRVSSARSACACASRAHARRGATASVYRVVARMRVSTRSALWTIQSSTYSVRPRVCVLAFQRERFLNKKQFWGAQYSIDTGTSIVHNVMTSYKVMLSFRHRKLKLYSCYWDIKFNFGECKKRRN
jgi:hypothetical protein